MSRSNLQASALRRIIARIEREDGERVTEATLEAIASELESHPDDAEPLERIARADEPWPAWLQDVLDRLFTHRMRGRTWRKIMAEVRAKFSN